MVSSFNTRKAALAISHGGIIAYPTEAVYGLGCDPYQSSAVYHLLALKQRPVEKGLILVGSRIEHFYDFIEPLSQEQQQQIQTHRTTSWIVPAAKAPIWLRGQHTSLAIRLSAHPVVVQLCNALGQAIVSTSANPAGKAPAKNALQTRHYFPDELDTILNSATGSLKGPTEIRDLLSNQIIRAN